MRPRKAKRTLTGGDFFRTVAGAVASGPVLLAGPVRPKTSAALREKVMLGVTSITDCRYCQWGHTHWAPAKGVPLKEVNQILGHEIETQQAKDPAEAAAILFAQHYAEQLDRCDPDSIAGLREYYSKAQVAEILACVRAITLCSLLGNTVQAFLHRVRGPAKRGPGGHATGARAPPDWTGSPPPRAPSARDEAGTWNPFTWSRSSLTHSAVHAQERHAHENSLGIFT
jgi:AhpD family alkylhydroperoxidase